MASRAPDANTQDTTIDERGDDRSYILLIVSFLCATLAGLTVLT